MVAHPISANKRDVSVSKTETTGQVHNTSHSPPFITIDLKERRGKFVCQSLEGERRNSSTTVVFAR